MNCFILFADTLHIELIMADEAASSASAPAQGQAKTAPANPSLKLSLEDLVASNKPKKRSNQTKKKPASQRGKPADRKARNDAVAPYQPRQVSSRKWHS